MKKYNDFLNEGMLSPDGLERMKALTNEGSLKRLMGAAERIKKDLDADGFTEGEVRQYIQYLLQQEYI